MVIVYIIKLDTVYSIKLYRNHVVVKVPVIGFIEEAQPLAGVGTGEARGGGHDKDDSVAGVGGDFGDYGENEGGGEG
ncbi:hypothetical protein RHGRI_011667 [Rhododendron griersonianum]|uniref:Glycine-rich protein n=1 Tax=Rhododendron griersonianum TaxID=479676 RepID=A0AAV6KN66_9ERIC|nr:hypothetical protein RHGRI_011667 [Rhododendron griersonianum]